MIKRRIFFSMLMVVLVSACSEKKVEPLVVPELTIKTVSTHHHMISGGDVLVAVDASEGIRLDDITVSLNGVDITAEFIQRTGQHQLLGLVTSLKDGENILSAANGQRHKVSSTAITLTSYPITGPIISGPHLKPFICQTEVFKLPDGTTLGAPLDSDCSIEPRIDYVYFSKDKNVFMPLKNLEKLPDDVAETKITTGLERPFIVRLETRTINRGIYQSSVLHDPTTEEKPTPFNPPQGWNKGLIAVHGFGCPRGWFRQGDTQGVSPLDVQRLGEGYAIFTNTLNHPTNSCNPVLAGETTMMGKEFFIEAVGEPEFTVSIGSSGGAYTSLQIADAFPGLFDGVLIGSTFPDALSIALSGMDAHLLAQYFLNNNSGGFSEAQIVAVSGYKNARAWYDIALQSGRTDPVSGRDVSIPGGPIIKGYRSGWWAEGIPEDIRFSADKNLKGARATIFDVAKNIYGTDPATGYARRPFDNIGVQYGLKALNNGTITTQQFFDLNTAIGGFDHNANPVPVRSIADSETLQRVYRSGISLSGGGGLAEIPVFDLSHLFDEDQLYHYQWFHFAVRERMKKHNGGTDNHVMWRGGGSAGNMVQLGGTPPNQLKAMKKMIDEESWQAFIQWVSNYKADKTTDRQLAKVIRHKPKAAQDGCFTWAVKPQFIEEPQTWSNKPDTACNKRWPSYSFVRKEAGGPLHANTLKCQLKLIDKNDYPANLTTSEWLQLEGIFPDGVCDWSQTGVEDTVVVPGLSRIFDLK